MVQVGRSNAVEAFLLLLDQAARRIEVRWFLLPFASRDSVDAAEYRERVYCYELYHQLRVLSDQPSGIAAGAPEYVLSGEIDKQGLNAVIDGGRHKPDLVWHVPGTSKFNAAVVEVKRFNGLGRDALKKDLKTLNDFLLAPGRQYERGVLLVFGPGDREDVRARVLAAAEALGMEAECRRRTHLLLHAAAGQGIDNLGTLLPG